MFIEIESMHHNPSERIIINIQEIYLIGDEYVTPSMDEYKLTKESMQNRL